ncbi:hypothetical protein BT69DRAFT_1283002 [Atractiella rhizophila]|nr:hypothetical protein BT69DRAFT_1283002 [Atractiella rhizophila]
MRCDRKRHITQRCGRVRLEANHEGGWIGTSFSLCCFLAWGHFTSSYPVCRLPDWNDVPRCVDLFGVPAIPFWVSSHANAHHLVTFQALLYYSKVY